jgi:Zn-dependent M16 (insulinase) family peptidase
MVPYALHGGNPLDMFRVNEYSQQMRDDYAKGGFFEGLIEKHLLHNQHYLKMLYQADPKKAEKEEMAEKKHLEQLEKILTQEEKNAIVA